MYEKYKIDIFSEIDRICDFPYELAVIDKTLDELKGKKGEKLSRKLLEIKKVKVIKTDKSGSVDKILKELNLKNTIIASNDRRLIKELKMPVIRLKQKKYLMIENVL